MDRVQVAVLSKQVGKTFADVARHRVVRECGKLGSMKRIGVLQTK